MGGEKALGIYTFSVFIQLTKEFEAAGVMWNEEDVMSQKMIHQIGRTQRIRILQLIKCSDGLPVRDLSERLRMSYMGVKQHCLSLEKEGYLKSWRKPKEGKVGRPELLYRLTARANDLFPKEAHQMTLDLLREAERLFGHSSAEKLLYSYYESRLKYYRAKVKGLSMGERAGAFVKLRNEEGFMCEVEPGPPLRITEFHSPVLLVLKKYPLIARLEEEMVAKLLDSPVDRMEQEVAGQFRCVFCFRGGMEGHAGYVEKVPREDQNPAENQTEPAAVGSISGVRAPAGTGIFDLPAREHPEEESAADFVPPEEEKQEETAFQYSLF